MKYLFVILSLWVTSQFVSGCRSSVESVPHTTASTKSARLARAAFENNELAKIPSDLTNKGVYLSEKEFFTVSGKTVSARLFIPNTTQRGADKPYHLAWRTEDRKVKAFLGLSVQDPYYSYLRQYCASEMIVRTDLLKDSSKEALNTLSEYTTMLVEEKSFNPALMYNALSRLRGSWTDQQLQNAVVETVSHSQRSLKKANEALQQMAEINSARKEQSPAAADYLAGQQEANYQSQLFIDKIAQLGK